MNSKKVKKLRKLAKDASANIESQNVSYIEMENKRKFATVFDLDENNKLVETRKVVSSGQLILSPASYKGIYNQLKSAMSGKE